MAILDRSTLTTKFLTVMSMGYGELEANNEKQSVSKVQRKSISLKLKRDSHDETSEYTQSGD